MSTREKRIVVVCSVLIGVLLMAGLAVGINNAGNTPSVEITWNRIKSNE